MGGILSYFFTDPNDNIVDLNSGFSHKEKKLIKYTWNKFIRSNLIDVGVNAMLQLLNTHPDMKNLFPDFKNILLCQLDSNKKFHAHCQMIMATVNNAVDAFLSDDVELFTAILIMTGERHAKRAMGKINAQHFEYLKDPLVDSLQQHMKSQWTDQVSDLWTRVVTKMIDGIINGMNNYNEKLKCNGDDQEQHTSQ